MQQTISIITLFPEYFNGVLNSSILKKAQEKDHSLFQVISLREFGVGKHQITDSRPYGGGAGMVMRVEPIAEAITSLGISVDKTSRAADTKVILTSAKGALFTQETALKMSTITQLVIICGHYEGVDERVASQIADVEIRVGDYVLTGGEPAAAVIIDAVVRQIPGVLGNELSLEDESHSGGLKFAAPQYTRPEEFQGWEVPQVLRSGNHEDIKNWKKEQQQE